jgi:hypothetical protein
LLLWWYETGVFDALMQGAASWLTMKYETIASSVSPESLGGAFMTLTIGAGLLATGYLFSELAFLVFERRALSKNSQDC